MKFFDAQTFSRLKEGLAKTRDVLVTKVNRLVTAGSKVDKQFLDALEEILIGADVGVEMTSEIISNIQQRVKDERYENQDELQRIIASEISKAFTHSVSERNSSDNGQLADPLFIPHDVKPYVIMIVGVNGVGKTTTIGKLAYNYKQAGKDVVIGAADTFRAAANEQLEIWAERAGVKIIQQLQGSDPAAVAFDTIQSAQSRGADVVIIDTAGRLHTKSNLMEELKKIKRVMDKSLSGAPHEVLLVIDASTGQNGIQQARQFHSAVGITGIAVTKLDGTAKGGIVLSISKLLNIPVRYVGVGEQIDDLQPFSAEAFTAALFQGNVHVERQSP
ncbi:MAG: signal recognition particle-docking protein FtsY [Bacteroidota bacterium]|nr:signal recognition particle-docking protein FtsY [Bacteroidota bacterium]